MLISSFHTRFCKTFGYGTANLGFQPTVLNQPYLRVHTGTLLLGLQQLSKQMTANSDNSRQLVGFHSRTQPHNQLVELTVVARAEVFGR